MYIIAHKHQDTFILPHFDTRLEPIIRKQTELLKNAVKKHDIIICTALIPGKQAPRIISEEMVKSMKPGSIIYDLVMEYLNSTI